MLLVGVGVVSSWPVEEWMVLCVCGTSPPDLSLRGGLCVMCEGVMV